VPNNREKASFLKENILPIQESGLLKFVPIEQDVELYKGFKIKFAYGHTEAMMLPVLELNNKTIVYMADLLPSSAHIPLPYIMGYDMRPLITLQEKELFLKEAVEKNYNLFFEHDNATECASVKATEKGIIVDSKFSLIELLSS
jgi:glyoxylase-like metal-dependent hydrolase (beta-lactamase superfamily II)